VVRPLGHPMKDPVSMDLNRRISGYGTDDRNDDR
jgi:hypothetical protein